MMVSNFSLQVYKKAPKRRLFVWGSCRLCGVLICPRIQSGKEWVQYGDEAPLSLKVNGNYVMRTFNGFPIQLCR